MVILQIYAENYIDCRNHGLLKKVADKSIITIIVSTFLRCVLIVSFYHEATLPYLNVYFYFITCLVTYDT